MVNKKISIFVIAFMFMTMMFSQNLYAASISMSAYQTLNIGGTTTITVSGSDATGRFNISSSNTGVVSLSVGSVWIEDNSSTVTATAKAAGTATITLTPVDVSNDAGADVTGSIGTKTLKITVNAPPPATTTTTTPSTTTTTKSSDANLKKLVANYEGLAPNFNPATTKYALTVPSTATSIKLTVATEDSGAKYFINGDTNLKLGDNTVTVTVTAANGTKKVYTIIVTRAADVAKANAYLSNITVDGYTLSPAFIAETLSYDLGTIKSDVEKLTVLAYAQDQAAKIEITGADKLVDGENDIKIKVTAPDGTTTKEYTLKATREAAAAQTAVNIYEESNSLQNAQPKNNISILAVIKAYLKVYWLVLALLACCLFELAQLLIFYKKYYKVYKTEKAQEKAKKRVSVDIPLDTDSLPSRRRNAEALKSADDASWRTDKKEDTNNENNNQEDLATEKVDDISDELTDNNEVNEEDDVSDNFEDSKTEEDNK